MTLIFLFSVFIEPLERDGGRYQNQVDYYVARPTYFIVENEGSLDSTREDTLVVGCLSE